MNRKLKNFLYSQNSINTCKSCPLKFKYKYIEIVYKYSATSGYSKCVFKTAYEASTTFFISSANAQQYGELIVSRGFTFTNSTTLTIDKGTKISMGSSSPTDDNNKIVPVAIYGSNVL